MNLTLRTRPVEGATVGTLSIDGVPDVFYSIELPWDDNLPDRSCVPAAIYALIRVVTEKHGLTWRLHNPAVNVYGEGAIPEGGRDLVEIHSANFARELLGCIALGLSCIPMIDAVAHKVVPAVQDSVAAIAKFRAILTAQPGPHTLTIIRDAAVPVPLSQAA